MLPAGSACGATSAVRTGMELEGGRGSRNDLAYWSTCKRTENHCQEWMTCLGKPMTGSMVDESHQHDQAGEVEMASEAETTSSMTSDISATIDEKVYRGGVTNATSASSAGVQTKVQGVGVGVLTVATANITSYGSIWRVIEAAKDFDVILVQEVRLHRDDIPWFWGTIGKAGWNSYWEAANETEKGSTSGGVGIMWRKNLSIIEKPTTIIPGRLASVTFRLGVLSVQIMSIYGKTGDEMGDENQGILKKLGKAVSASMHHVIVGGDFNIEAGLLHGELSKWLPTMLMKAPKGNTTFPSVGMPSTLDYFLIDKHLAVLCGQPQILGIDRCPLATHRVVQIGLNLKLNDTMVEVLVRPPRPGAAPVVGPHWPPPSWETWHEQASALLEGEVEKGHLPDRCIGKATEGQKLKLEGLLTTYLDKLWEEARPLFGIDVPPWQKHQRKMVSLRELLRPPGGRSAHRSRGLWTWLVGALQELKSHLSQLLVDLDIHKHWPHLQAIRNGGWHKGKQLERLLRNDPSELLAWKQRVAKFEEVLGIVSEGIWHGSILREAHTSVELWLEKVHAEKQQAQVSATKKRQE